MNETRKTGFLLFALDNFPLNIKDLYLIKSSIILPTTGCFEANDKTFKTIFGSVTTSKVTKFYKSFSCLDFLVFLSSLMRISFFLHVFSGNSRPCLSFFTLFKNSFQYIPFLNLFNVPASSRYRFKLF